jgi:predicted dehydrogenase
MRVAVLGLGFMGATHLRALARIPEALLAAVCSRDESRLAGDFSGVGGNLGSGERRFDFNGVARYRDIDAVLNDASIDAVDICLPTHLHAPVAIAALRAGKHAVVEKPMALDEHDAQAMMREAERSGRVLMAAHVLRFFPEYQALEDTLASNELGVWRFAEFRRRCAAPAWSGWLRDPALSGGGVFDLLIHDVDMCLHLFGKPRTISAVGHQSSGGADLISAELRYPNHCAVTIAGGWHAPGAYPFVMEYSVSCENGTIEYSSAGCAPTLFSAAARTLPLRAADGYESELRYFLNCCADGRAPERCPPVESAAAVALTRLLLEARARSGEVIPCEI